jgi:hypothetical protein
VFVAGGGIAPGDVHGLQALEQENSGLKKIVAEQAWTSRCLNDLQRKLVRPARRVKP